MSDKKRLVMVVGCGGVGFHALSAIAVDARLTGAKVVACDGDTMEEGNVGRQAWGEPGKQKVHVAEDLLQKMGIDDAVGLMRTVDAMALLEIERAMKAGWDVEGVWDEVCIVCMPDNHKARLECLQGARRMAMTGRVRGNGIEGGVQVIVAGNDVIYNADGEALGEAGTVYAMRGYMGTKRWDGPDGGGREDKFEWLVPWAERHQDMFEEEEPELDGIAHCAERPEQTMVGNMLTATCVAEALQHLREGGSGSDWYWEKWYSKSSSKGRTVMYEDGYPQESSEESESE